MKIYLMRHGPAEDQADSGVDADRALTPSGRDRVRSVGKLLVDAGEEPVHIITSPLVRAVQTAEIVALSTKLGERGGTLEISRAIAPGGHGATIAREAALQGRKRVMLVGHEPDLSELAAELLGAFERPFEKAMVVAAHLPNAGERASLRFIVDPKKLRIDRTS